VAALKPALDPGWLNVDSTANVNSGRTPQVNPGADIPNPPVPTADAVVPVDVPAVAPDATEAVYSGGTWDAAAWGGFTQGGFRQGPASVQDSDGGNAYANVLARPVSSVQQTLNEYAGYDAHSQATDDKGWMQNTPSGRTAVRRLLWADDVGYRVLWPRTAENPVQKRFAAGAAPNNSPDGTPGVLNGAQLPDWGNLVRGGPGNIAYETPGPPAVAGAQDQAPGLSWGNWNG
jgi:hypothetical protein